MNWTQLITSLLVLAITIVVSIIAYFLKRTISEVDLCAAEIKDIKRGYATIEKVDELRDDLKEKISEMSHNVDDIKDNYIKKDEFLRSIADVQRSQERMLNMLFDLTGGHRNG